MTKKELERKIKFILERFSSGGVPMRDTVQAILDLMFWKVNDKT